MNNLQVEWTVNIICKNLAELDVQKLLRMKIKKIIHNVFSMFD
jgi:hypothetical protein